MLPVHAYAVIIRSPRVRETKSEKGEKTRPHSLRSFFATRMYIAVTLSKDDWAFRFLFAQYIPVSQIGKQDIWHSLAFDS